MLFDDIINHFSDSFIDPCLVSERGRLTEGLHFGSVLKDHAPNTSASMDIYDNTCILHGIREVQSLDS
jgi:hypothetical protein